MTDKRRKRFHNQGGGFAANQLFITAVVLFFFGGSVPLRTAKQLGGPEQTAVATQVQSLTPRSIEMVDNALAVLGQGWSGMSAAEKEAFLTLADPAGTGEVDAAYVQAAATNYRKIRRALTHGVPIIFEADSAHCMGQRLYYVMLASLHVCPFFLTEPDGARKARSLIHEYAHLALHVRDRPYYRPTSKAFAALTPRGPRLSRVSIVGPIVREIAASDTLFHPDTYAHFALAMSGEPGALEKYLDPSQEMAIVRLDGTPPDHGPDYQVMDSWLLP
ncbi:MAG: hypothetical protein ACE5EY_10840 [Anaerolineae bacterium]